jgi:superfamily II DNA helicase RecQ
VLRQALPGVPLMAVTATATQRVQQVCEVQMNSSVQRLERRQSAGS